MKSLNDADFDQQTVHAMNEMATLLRAAQQTHAMSKTFKYAQELDKVAATPFAKAVISFSKDASTAILSQLCKPATKREVGLIEVRATFAKRLAKAISDAESLSAMEKEGIGAMGGKGNVIRLMVLEPLQSLGWN